MSAVGRRRRYGHSTRVTRVTTVLLVLAAVVVLVAAIVVVTRTGGAPSAAARGTAVSTVDGSPAADTGVAAPVHWPAAVFLGDSWTAGNGMGGRGAANYSAILAAQNRWYASNFSYGGTSYHLGSPDQQFASGAHLRSLTAADPDVVFVVNGVNDIDRVSLAAWRNNAAATYAAVHAAAPTARLVVVGPIAPGPAAKIPGYAAWNTALAEVAAAHDAVYVDAYAEDWFGGRAASYIGSDGFHPDDAGQAYLATRLQADLVRLGVVAELEKTREGA